MNIRLLIGSFCHESARLFKCSSYMARVKTIVVVGLALISLCSSAMASTESLRIINTFDYGVVARTSPTFLFVVTSLFGATVLATILIKLTGNWNIKGINLLSLMDLLSMTLL